jgi:hypothetical protein
VCCGNAVAPNEKELNRLVSLDKQISVRQAVVTELENLMRALADRRLRAIQGIARATNAQR